MSNIYHEESIRILATIFHDKQEFWGIYQKYRQQYLHASRVESAFKLEMSPEEKIVYSDYKSSFGKLSIESLFLLEILDENQKRILLHSHKLVACGLQLEDDAMDLIEDLEHGQTNLAYVQLIKSHGLEKIQQLSTNPLKLKSFFLQSDVCKNILQKAANYLSEALLLIDEKMFPHWFQVIRRNLIQVNQKLNTIQFYLKEVDLKQRLSQKPLHSGPPKPTNKSSVKEAIQRAMNFISNEQEANGAWLDMPVNTTSPFSDSWVSGFILQNIKDVIRSGSFKNEQLSKSGSEFLIASQKAGLWGYRSGGAVDADSTNFALLALKDQLNQESIGQSINELYDFQCENGGVATYRNKEDLDNDPFTPVFDDMTGWLQSHACVSAVSLYLLASQKHTGLKFQNLKRYLLSQIEDNGFLKAYWWTDPLYSTSFLVKAAAILNDTDLSKAASLAIQTFRASYQYESGNKNNFYKSLFIDASIEFGGLSYDDEIVKSQVETLLQNQTSDGSWFENTMLRVPSACCTEPDRVDKWSHNLKDHQFVLASDMHRLFTTSTACRLLHKYYNQL